MAINSLIVILEEFGISATQEHRDTGTWSHTEEYIAIRYGGVRKLMRLLLNKATEGSERARLQLALVRNMPLDQVDKLIENAVAEA